MGIGVIGWRKIWPKKKNPANTVQNSVSWGFFLLDVTGLAGAKSGNSPLPNLETRPPVLGLWESCCQIWKL